MLRSLAIVTVAVLAASCAAPSNEPAPIVDDNGGGDVVIATHSSFSLTFTSDRDMFTFHDLAYAGAVGPYAMLEVTGPAPSLAGPAIDPRFARSFGMICGAQSYFTDDPDGVRATIRLSVGGEVISTAEVGAGDYDSCSQAKDDYAERVDGLDGDGAGARNEIGGASQQTVEVAVDPAPPAGALLLIREFGVVDEGGHNDSHLIPDACCTSSECGLNDVPVAG